MAETIYAPREYTPEEQTLVDKVFSITGEQPDFLQINLELFGSAGVKGWQVMYRKPGKPRRSCGVGETKTDALKDALSEIAPAKMEYEEYKEAVITAVAESIGKEPWYKGCCLDTIRSSWNNDVAVGDAAQTAASETILWDGPHGNYDTF